MVQILLSIGHFSGQFLWFFVGAYEDLWPSGSVTIWSLGTSARSSANWLIFQAFDAVHGSSRQSASLRIPVNQIHPECKNGVLDFRQIHLPIIPNKRISYDGNWIYPRVPLLEVGIHHDDPNDVPCAKSQVVCVGPCVERRKPGLAWMSQSLHTMFRHLCNV